jgi:hypothetical protein
VSLCWLERIVLPCLAVIGVTDIRTMPASNMYNSIVSVYNIYIDSVHSCTSKQLPSKSRSARDSWTENIMSGEGHMFIFFIVE